jgi:hypothetical protein
VRLILKGRRISDHMENGPERDIGKWLLSKARPKIYSDKLEANAARNLASAFDISGMYWT